MKKQPYWVHGYGTVKCSECGYVTDTILKTDLCPACNADMREPLKRCYFLENNPESDWNPCGESTVKDGVMYCTRQTRERMEELKKWGFYYKCSDYHLKDDEIQLTLF